MEGFLTTAPKEIKKGKRLESLPSSTSSSSDVDILPYLQKLTDHKLFTEQQQVKSDTRDTQNNCKNLLAFDKHYGSFLFVCDREGKLKSINLKALKLNEPHGTRYQRIYCSPEISFEVRRILLNSTSKYLCLIGTRSCSVVEISPRTRAELAKQSSDPDDTKIICRSFSVGSEFLHSISPSIVDVIWHPFSDNHLGILTSDNTLRLYNLALDCQEAEQTFRLSSMPRRNEDKVPNIGRCVSFCFGLSGSTKRGHIWDPFTLYVLLDNGDIYAIAPVIPHNCLIPSSIILEPAKVVYDQLSTLQNSEDKKSISYYESLLEWLLGVKGETVVREADIKDREENDGWLRTKPAEHTSLLYLQGPLTPSNTLLRGTFACQLLSLGCTPATLLRLYQSGTIQVLINFDQVMPKWKRSIFEDQITSELLLYESFSIPLSSLSVIPNAIIDPLYRNRIYISHGSGVHRALLSWIDTLENFVINSLDDPTKLPDLPASSVANLLTTTTSMKTPGSNPPIGLTVITDPLLGYALLVLNSEWKCVAVNLNIFEYSFPPLPQSTLKATSTLEPFQNQIEPILKQKKPNPIPTIATSMSSSSITDLDYLVNATNHMQKEHFYFIQNIHAAITQRLKLLESVKQKRSKDINGIEKTLEQLTQESEETKKKMAKLNKTHQLLVMRAEAVLKILITHDNDRLSLAERQFFDELEEKKKSLPQWKETVKQLSNQAQKLVTPTKQSAKLPQNKLEQIKTILDQEQKLITEAVQGIKKLQIEVEETFPS